MIPTPIPISRDTVESNVPVASPSSKQERIPRITYVAGDAAAIRCSQPGSVSIGY